VITGDEGPERAFSTLVSANLFTTLGVHPLHGQGFVPDHEQLGSGNAVVISHEFWQRRYGGDETAVGSFMMVGGESYEILGVMPPGFNYPGNIDMWFPMQFEGPYTQGRGNNNFFIVGRLRDGTTLQQAQAQVDVIARGLQDQYPETNAGWGLRLESLHERYFGDLRTVLIILMGLVGLVLLTACANVASLALARSATRSSEIAVRFSLGASRIHVLRQLLSESLLVALAGGAVGLILAQLGIVALKQLSPAGLPRLDTIGIDRSVLVFALGVSVVTAILFSIVPALRSTRLGLSEALRSTGSRGASTGRLSIRSGLVVAQVALSLTLMIASGLLVRSYNRLQGVDAGFPVEGLLLAEVQLPAFKYQTAEELEAVWVELLDQVRAIPGISAVGAIDQAPIRSGGTWNTVWPTGREPTTSAERAQLGAQRRIVTAGYLETIDIPIVNGRSFEASDRVGGPPVTIISRTMADRLFPSENPVGQFVVVWGTDTEVVGIAGDVREFGPGSEYPSVFYLPIGRLPLDRMQLMVRVSGDPMVLGGALREAVWAVDRDAPVTDIQTMEARVSGSLAQPRFRMMLVALFSVVALILSSMGLYGVLAYFVRQRTRELGIRMALGAKPADLMNLVVRRGMMLVGLGVAVGLVGGVICTVATRSLLFESPAVDVPTFAGTSITLVVVALIACLVPALRAVRLEPQEVLRVE
jgi:predicted permease